MNISRKVHQWKAAGLIDEDTAQRIEAFECSGARPIVLYTVGGLGALTIGVGIISLVAANWEGLGSPVKLAVDLVLAVVLAAATFHMAHRERRWPTEVLVVIYYVFSLASLALVGQIYQSGTPVHEALLVWSAATLPLMLLGRSRFLGLVWCVGLAISEGAAVVAWLDYLGEVVGVGRSILINVTASTAFVSLLAFVVAGHILALRVQRAHKSVQLSGVSAGRWRSLVASRYRLPGTRASVRPTHSSAGPSPSARCRQSSSSRPSGCSPRPSARRCGAPSACSSRSWWGRWRRRPRLSAPRGRG